MLSQQKQPWIGKTEVIRNQYGRDSLQVVQNERNQSLDIFSLFS